MAMVTNSLSDKMKYIVGKHFEITISYSYMVCDLTVMLLALLQYILELITK